MQVTVSVVMVTTHKQRESDVDNHHHHQLMRLACDNGGVVVHWPAEPLTDLLDRHSAEQRPSTAVGDDRWTLPYVSAATTTTTRQTQPVVSLSVPVYSNHSHRSANSTRKVVVGCHLPQAPVYLTPAGGRMRVRLTNQHTNEHKRMNEPTNQQPWQSGTHSRLFLYPYFPSVLTAHCFQQAFGSP